MCARFTVLSDAPIASAIAGCVIPLSRSSTIWMRSRCLGKIFFHRRSAVFSRLTSDLLHLTICFSRIRWSQRNTTRVEGESPAPKMELNRNKYPYSVDSISYRSGITFDIGGLLLLEQLRHQYDWIALRRITFRVWANEMPQSRYLF